MADSRYECRLFEIDVHGVMEARVVCDLVDRVLHIVTPSLCAGAGAYAWMRSSPNLDERRSAEAVCRKRETGSVERVIHIGEEEAAEIAAMLTRECIRGADGMTDSMMTERCKGWCYREHWTMTFTAYGPDGTTIAATEPLTHRSFWGQELGFERIAMHLFDHYGILDYGDNSEEIRKMGETLWAGEFCFG